MDLNNEQAIGVFQRAADEGNTSAMNRVGQLHFFGWCALEKSFSEARRWYELAAARGDGNAADLILNLHGVEERAKKTEVGAESGELDHDPKLSGV